MGNTGGVGKRRGGERRSGGKGNCSWDVIWERGIHT